MRSKSCIVLAAQMISQKWLQCQGVNFEPKPFVNQYREVHGFRFENCIFLGSCFNSHFDLSLLRFFSPPFTLV